MEDYIIQEKSKQNWLIAIVSITVFMFNLDYSMVNISLPAITKYFNANLASVSRIPLIYLLIVTSTALLFGKLGDIIGFKKIFITGLIVFVTGTFLCGIAQTLNILLGLRIYQCLGEAMFSPIGIAIATVFLPSSIKGRALGIMATAQGLGFALGSAFGGYLNDHLSWHSIFFVNVPIGILMIIASIKIIPSKQPLLKNKRIDILGAILIFLSLSTLIYALNSISALGLKNPLILSCFVVSIIMFILFLLRENKTPSPILDLSLFKNRNFSFATTSALCVVFAYMGLIFLFPFFLNMVLGVDILRAGIILMVPALMLIISAPIAGLISDKFGSRIICSFGIALTTFAFFMFSLVTPKTPLSHIIPSLIFAGIAIGCFLPANNKLVMALAPIDKQGMASAIYKIINSMGGIFGIVILPLIIMKKVYAKLALMNIEKQSLKLHPEILMSGLSDAFRFCVLVCLAGLLLTILTKDKLGHD